MSYYHIPEYNFSVTKVKGEWVPAQRVSTSKMTTKKEIVQAIKYWAQSKKNPWVKHD